MATRLKGTDVQEVISLREAARRLGVNHGAVSAAIQVLGLQTAKVSAHNRIRLIDQKTFRVLEKKFAKAKAS